MNKRNISGPSIARCRCESRDQIVFRLHGFRRDVRLRERALRAPDPQRIAGIERENPSAHFLIRGRMAAERQVIVEPGRHAHRIADPP